MKPRTHWVLLIVGLAGMGCAALLRPREDWKPLKRCQDHLIDFTTRCSGRILADGVANCNLCFRKTSKVFPGKDDMVGGCYDEERNAYCVDLDQGCGDGTCRESPVPAFGTTRPDAGPKDATP